MKRGLLAWFLFIIVCCKARPCSSSESTLMITTKAGDHKHLEKEKQLIIKNGFGSKVIKSKQDGNLRACKGTEVDEVLHLGKVEKGKKAIYQLKKANRGVYGGADLLHPRKKGGASSSVLKSSSLALPILAIGLLFFFILLND